MDKIVIIYNVAMSLMSFDPGCVFSIYMALGHIDTKK